MFSNNFAININYVQICLMLIFSNEASIIDLANEILNLCSNQLRGVTGAALSVLLKEFIVQLIYNRKIKIYGSMTAYDPKRVLSVK